MQIRHTNRELYFKELSITSKDFILPYVSTKKNINKGSTEPTCIPIKAVHKEGKCLIVYITPIWNNCMYGDELICNYNNCESVIDMKENLETAVSSLLRSEYLTQNGKSQFKSKRNIYLQDGYDGYDLLIDNFDFDYTWRNTVAKYKVRIQITLSVTNGIYQIDSIARAM